MIRPVAVVAGLLALTAPASAREAANDPPRLTYSLQIGLPAAPDRGGRLVPAGLCLAGPNGSEGVRLTEPAPAFDPAWSPDGRRLAFWRRWNGIFLQDENGTRTIFRSGGLQRIDDLDWSPSGRRIVFDTTRVSIQLPASRIYSVGSGGSDLRGLTDPSDVWAESPAWSPDGGAIVYSQRPAPGSPLERGRWDVYVMDADGSNRRLLARDGYDPSWSPDGNAVVFVRSTGGAFSEANTELVLVGADGLGERTLTATPEVETDPAWSPDGESIAFEQRAPADGIDATQIAVVRPDGSGLRVVRGSSLGEFDPAWRPAAPRRPGRQRPCVIRGTSRANAIRGSSRADFVIAGAGNDSIAGGGGADLVDGGPGGDRVTGGPGADVVSGGLGRDRLLGGPGDDVLHGDDGERDVLGGGSGRDSATTDPVDSVSSVEVKLGP